MVSRAQRSSRERGAAVLIVMLAVTMLTAVGVFAAHRSAMVTGASGYDRQATQTRYLAEYAGTVTASELGDNRAGEYLRLAIDPRSDLTETCSAHANTVSSLGRLPCYVLEPDDLQARVDAQIRGRKLLEQADDSNAGSLSGPGSTDLQGLMRVELFDARALQAAAGEDASGSNPFRPVEVVASAWAQIRATPSSETETETETEPTTWTATPGTAGHASVQALRVHFRVPNVSLSLLRN